MQGLIISKDEAVEVVLRGEEALSEVRAKREEILQAIRDYPVVIIQGQSKSEFGECIHNRMYRITCRN